MKIEEKAGQLVVTDFNELEAYKIAIKIEKDGINFYENLINKEKNAAVKKELEFLLSEERQHLKLFQERLYELREKLGDNFETDDVLNYLDYGIFHPYQDIKHLEKALNNIKKTLRLGIIIEEKSVKFYQACLEHVSTPQAKDALKKIIQEETNHQNIFETMLGKV